MGRSTLGNDDLFGGAAVEMHADVKGHLGEVRSALLDPDDMQEADVDNVLGVLNGLHSSLGIEGATEHVRQTREQCVIGQRTETFDDPEDLEVVIEELEALIEMVEEAHELAGELTNTIPQLHGTLTDVAGAAEVASTGEDEDKDEGEK